MKQRPSEKRNQAVENLVALGVGAHTSSCWPGNGCTCKENLQKILQGFEVSVWEARNGGLPEDWWWRE